MKTSRLFAFLLVTISFYLLYVLVDNYVLDPKAEQFLALKTGIDRVLNLPVWLNVMYVHVAFATIATATGAMNFSKYLRNRFRGFHRVNGYVYVVSVMLVVLTSGYMAPYSTGGKPVSVAYNMMNIVWPAFTVIAIMRIKKKDVVGHLRSMVRSYVFCFTNVFVHTMTFLAEQGLRLPHETSYTFGVFSAFALNLLIAELIIAIFYAPSRVANTSTYIKGETQPQK